MALQQGWEGGERAWPCCDERATAGAPVLTVCPEAPLSLLEAAWIRVEEAEQKWASPAAPTALFRKTPL